MFRLPKKTVFFLTPPLVHSLHQIGKCHIFILLKTAKKLPLSPVHETDARAYIMSRLAGAKVAL